MRSALSFAATATLALFAGCADDRESMSHVEPDAAADAAADANVDAAVDAAADADVDAAADANVDAAADANVDAAVDASADAGVELWNGVDLSEWDGDLSVWRVRGDAIVARTDREAIAENTFLVSRVGAVADFELSADVWLEAGGNSGIQYRSTVVDPERWVVAGYQADAAEEYWGAIFEERLGRGVLAPAAPECLQAVRAGEWNRYEITTRGDLLVQRVNGLECARFVETEAERPRSGVIALQYHAPGGFEVRFRDLQLIRD